VKSLFPIQQIESKCLLRFVCSTSPTLGPDMTTPTRRTVRVVSDATVVPGNPPERECRPCAACCIHLSIPAGQLGPGAKPPGIECPHLSSAGCRIHSRRMQLCVEFRCAWLGDEAWPDSWRPDRSGLMCLRESIENRWIGALAYEVLPDSLQTPVAVEIIEALQRTSSVVALVDFQGQRSRLCGHRADQAEGAAPKRPHFLSPGPRRRAESLDIDRLSDATD